jgi:ATP-dependent Clp protease adaptor protein ClpS
MTDSVVMPDEITKVEKLPPYNLILYNDEVHSFDFVIYVLIMVFKYSAEKAFQFADETHTSGRSIVWSGGREVGELKMEQMLSFSEGKHGPLTVSLEQG